MKVAIVDDSKEDAGLLTDYIKKFENEKNIKLQCCVFYASFDFLETYHGEYDVIFLDIEMPGSNGLEVAREIRSKDDAVGIIFVTSMAQYAIHGYEVNAIDFIVKPVRYYNFATKLEKAYQFCRKRSTHNILLNNKDGIQRFPASDILYIEKDGDYLIFHTVQGSFQGRGSIKAMKEKLAELYFEESISGCLINLEYVIHIGKDSVTVESDVQLPLSRRLKKQFSQKYMKYMGGEF
ncbi:LytTR family DNA-binding domain-containing protein [Lachnospiraceae bacterium 29-84]